MVVDALISGKETWIRCMGFSSKQEPQVPNKNVSKKWGFERTRKMYALFLHSIEGLPAVGMSPFTSGWTTSGKVVVTDGCDAISACLSAGLLPVIHGDCVLDSHLGCTILRFGVDYTRATNTLNAVHPIPLFIHPPPFRF
jgi:hypothetical protein